MTQTTSSVSRFFIIVAIAVFFGDVVDAKSLSRVVGGEDGQLDEFPYQASVRKYNQHWCGGTIIGKRHILTAAHCVTAAVDRPTQRMSVITGTNDLYTGEGVNHDIETVTIHPRFSGKSDDSWRNDIAVIALTRDIVFDTHTQPARLPTVNTPSVLDCVATGWGVTSHPSSEHSTNLKKVTLTTIDNESCRQRRLDVPIFDGHICAAASRGFGLCHGDSGGPLVHNGEVVGVASFVTPCATGYPDVFTRVYSYLGFIKGAIAST